MVKCLLDGPGLNLITNGNLKNIIKKAFSIGDVKAIDLNAHSVGRAISRAIKSDEILGARHTVQYVQVK